MVTSWRAEERAARLRPEEEELREPFRSPPEERGVGVAMVACLFTVVYGSGKRKWHVQVASEDMYVFVVCVSRSCLRGEISMGRKDPINRFLRGYPCRWRAPF